MGPLGLAAQGLVSEVVEDVVGIVGGRPEVLHPPVDGGVGRALALSVRQDGLDTFLL